MERLKDGSLLAQMLNWCEAREASDLHAQASRPHVFRAHGQLNRIPEDVFPILTESQWHEELAANFSSRFCERVKISKEVDLSFYAENRRYRANFSKQKGSQSLSFRTVPQQKHRLQDLQLPDSLRELTTELRGLILVTGPTGQGKSTTVRALLQEVNATRAVRIVTVEDPIEYVFQEDLCHFEQREVGIDTATFADGIRNAMRQDPNVIFVGEIRDRESIFAALQAAETGHLVITTLHADSSAQAIARLREYYPGNEQANVSSLIARNLNAIVCQRLVPNVHGNRTPCLELMKADSGIRGAIRNNELELLTGIIEMGIHQGMHSFDQYLQELMVEGIILEQTALTYAVNRHKLELTIRGVETATPILRRDVR